MNNITDEILFLYIINKSLLDEKMAKDIEKNLILDKKFNARFENFKDIFEGSINLSEDGYIILHSINKPINNLTYSKLAADNSVIENKFNYVTTFASAENIVLVRVLHNQSTNEYKLFLICDDMAKVRNASVKIDDYSEDFITDDEGIISLKGGFIDSHTFISVKLKD